MCTSSCSISIVSLMNPARCRRCLDRTPELCLDSEREREIERESERERDGVKEGSDEREQVELSLSLSLSLGLLEERRVTV